MKCLFVSTLLLIGLLAFGVVPASAHQTITVGNYELVVGWLDEPVVVGSKNAVFVTVTDRLTRAPVQDITTLEAQIIAGPTSKSFILRALDVNTPGRYGFHIIPTVRGIYRLHLTGSIGNEVVDATVDMHEVGDPNSLAFPEPLAAVEDGAARTLGLIGLIAGVLGLILAGVSLARKK